MMQRFDKGEGITGLLSFCVGFYVPWALGAGWSSAMSSGVLAAAMSLIAISDLRRFIIPDAIVIAVAALGIMRIVLYAHGEGELLDATLFSGLYGGSFLLIRELFHYWRKRHGLGLGDVKLAAAAGPWLEPTDFAQVVLFAALAGLIAILLKSYRRRRRLSRVQRLPLGAFLAPAIWIMWLAGQI
jgi:leader peptidase (prepilin peptidase) / N-methyltransferase